MSSVSFAAFSFPVITRAADVADAAAVGIQEGPALDLWLAARGPRRHNRRVVVAIASALAWAVGDWAAQSDDTFGALTEDDLKIVASMPDAKAALDKAEALMSERLGEERPFVDRWAAKEAVFMAAFSALTLDAIGVGGTLNAGLGFVRIARHPAFAACGSGKKQSKDGEVWTKAIAEAAAAFGEWRVLSGLRLGWIMINCAGEPAGVLAVLGENDRQVSGWNGGHSCPDDPDFQWVVTAARRAIFDAARGVNVGDAAAAALALDTMAAKMAANMAEKEAEKVAHENAIVFAKAALADAQGIYDVTASSLAAAERELREARAGVGLRTVEDAQATLAAAWTANEAAKLEVSAAHNALLDARKGDTSGSW